MIYPFNQHWRTSLKPHTLSLARAVNTGVTFTTPSRAMANSKIWASAGFRGYGPTLTFPGGSGMDGLGCGCGCGGGCGGEMSRLLWLAAGAAAFYFLGRERSF